MKLLVLLLMPCSALAGGTVSVSIADLGAVTGVESFNIQGNYDAELTDKITYKAAYTFNKDRFRPSAVAASSSVDTLYGRLKANVVVDPQEKTANVEATLRNEQLGAFSTNYKAAEKSGGTLGAFRWTSNPIAFPFALREATPMVMSASHNINTKEGQISIAAKLNNNFDGKVLLPSEGDPIITLVGSHSPDMNSDIRVSANVLDLTGQGFGKGAVGMTYRRDLDTVSGSTSRVTLEGRDTGDYAWSLSNTSKRMTLVLSGRGRFAKRGSGEGVASTVSLRQSFRLF